MKPIKVTVSNGDGYQYDNDILIDRKIVGAIVQLDPNKAEETLREIVMVQLRPILTAAIRDAIDRDPEAEKEE